MYRRIFLPHRVVFETLTAIPRSYLLAFCSTVAFVAHFMSGTAELRLADHFPRSKGCESYAQTFFDCLSTVESSGEENHNVLKQCQKSMRYYDNCMVKALKKYPPKFSRAGAAYRQRSEPEATP